MRTACSTVKRPHRSSAERSAPVACHSTGHRLRNCSTSKSAPSYQTILSDERIEMGATGKCVRRSRVRVGGSLGETNECLHDPYLFVLHVSYGRPMRSKAMGHLMRHPLREAGVVE